MERPRRRRGEADGRLGGRRQAHLRNLDVRVALRPEVRVRSLSVSITLPSRSISITSGKNITIDVAATTHATRPPRRQTPALLAVSAKVSSLPRRDMLSRGCYVLLESDWL